MCEQATSWRQPELKASLFHGSMVPGAGLVPPAAIALPTGEFVVGAIEPITRRVPVLQACRKAAFAVMLASVTFMKLQTPSVAREFGHERLACVAWDVQLRYMIEQRVQLATLPALEGEVILDEVKHASRLCDVGRFRAALDRFAALHNMLSGEDEGRDEQG